MCFSVRLPIIIAMRRFLIRNDQLKCLRKRDSSGTLSSQNIMIRLQQVCMDVQSLPYTTHI